MFHTCVQRFDGMDEKILGGELNMAFAWSPRQAASMHEARLPFAIETAFFYPKKGLLLEKLPPGKKRKMPGVST